MRKTVLTAFFLCLAAAGLCSARPARALYVTGSELALYCTGDSPRDLYTCAGYIAGIIDYHLLIQSLGTAPSVDFCLPESLTIQQAAAVVVVYLRRQPSHNPFIGAPAVALALHEAFPCAAPKRGKKKR